MNCLKDNGIGADLIRLNTDVDYDNIRSFQTYGIYPFSLRPVFQKMKEEGKRIIYDNDDAVGLVDETNPFYYAVKKDTGSQAEILEFADHLTVSTEVMKEYLRTKTDKPITVVPNCYLEREWAFAPPQRSVDEIRIGFSGSCTHVPDLIKIIPIVKKLQETKNIKFYILGFGYGSYDEWKVDFKRIATPVSAKLLDELDKEIQGFKYEWMPYVPYQEFPKTLISMGLDIGICPLNDTPFNRARSACKALEYNLTGAFVLASDLAPYQAEPTSVLTKDHEWEEKLTYYVNNPEERAKLHQEHLKWIKENREINKIFPLLKQIYLPE